jgi:hypothetical protein
MKLSKNKYFWIVAVLLSGYFYIASCTHDDELIVPVQLTKPFVPTRGTTVHLPGNMTAGNTNEWKFGKLTQVYYGRQTMLGRPDC